MTAGGAEISQKCHKYFLQYSTFASESPQVRTWGRQTCFLPRAPSNLVDADKLASALSWRLACWPVSLSTELEKILDLKIFSECFRGHSKRLARGPLIAHPCSTVYGLDRQCYRICIALYYWGKHKRKMVIRGIKLTGKQPAAIDLTRRDHSRRHRQQLQSMGH